MAMSMVSGNRAMSRWERRTPSSAGWRWDVDHCRIANVIGAGALLIPNQYRDDRAEAALRLLPEWVQWRIEHSGLDGEAAMTDS